MTVTAYRRVIMPASAARRSGSWHAENVDFRSDSGYLARRPGPVAVSGTPRATGTVGGTGLSWLEALLLDL